MNILDRYIVRTILGSVLMVGAALLVLGALITFIGEQDDIGSGGYTALGALWYTLLNLPIFAFDLLPIVALMGSLVGLGALARNSEITVVRATGISVRHLAGICLLAAFVLVGVAVLLGEFLGPALQQTAREQKAFSRFNNVAFAGGGAWVRDGNLILHVAGQSSQSQFAGMQIFELSPGHRLLAMGQAQHATAAASGKKGKWLLADYTESRFSGDSVSRSGPDQRVLNSNVTAGFLGLAVENPDQLTNRALWRLISYYRENGLADREYVFAFWSRIARTVAVIFTVLLAIPFVLGSLRSTGTGTRMLMGLVLGIGFFLLEKLIESGTVVFNLNPILLAWLPTALLALVTVTLVARAR
ncbi:MAG TPA: LPS export ABC transporter permease LptG [Steroidobacteraceae bacterium]|nr:LPS export ABC transporter permease LptG [Steroidobacteraceae bacterium]